MTTKLEKDLKREITIDGKAYTLTFSPLGLKVTEKGRRTGHELQWKDIVHGTAVAPTAPSASADPS